jgi:hypothetical protein
MDAEMPQQQKFVSKNLWIFYLNELLVEKNYHASQYYSHCRYPGYYF